jgi:hypothetical protein
MGNIVGLESVHIKIFIPVRIKSLFDHACGVGLFGIDSDDSERVGKTENVALGESIRSYDCMKCQRVGLHGCMSLRTKIRTCDSDLLRAA